MPYVQYEEPYPESRGDRFGATAGRAHPHRGQDTAPGGYGAFPIADGVVAGTDWTRELGNIVVVRHPDGKYSGYCHLAAFSVDDGTPVTRGKTRLGTIGATGTAAKGRHLHYTLGNDKWGCISGHVEDPLAWIRAHSGPESDVAFVKRVSAYLNGRVLGLDTNAVKDGIRGEAYWTCIQTAGRKDGRYGTSYKIDGIPGPKSHELEKYYGSIA